jgi:hypothetical protein
MTLKRGISEEAVHDQKGFYDRRYDQGYMKDFSGLYEACRLVTVRETLARLVAQGFRPSTVLDYGCGEGRYVGV